jgi:hypothetical protein
MAMMMNCDNMRVAEKESNLVVKDDLAIPEVIEERRKDVDGRVTCVNKYMKGRMLGKVLHKLLLYRLSAIGNC